MSTYRTDQTCQTPEWHRPHWVDRPTLTPGSGLWCEGHASPEDDPNEVVEPEVMHWCSEADIHEPHWSAKPTTDNPGGTWCLGEKRPLMKMLPRYRGMEAAMLGYFEKRGIDVPVYTTGNKAIEEAHELAQAWAEGDRAHIMEEIADLAIVAAVAAHSIGTTVEECVKTKTERDTGRGPKVKALNSEEVVALLWDNDWRPLNVDQPTQPYVTFFRNGMEILLPTDPARGDYQSLLERAARQATSPERPVLIGASCDHLLTEMLAAGWMCTNWNYSFYRLTKDGHEPVIVPAPVGEENFDEALAAAYERAGVTIP